jgi:endoglucanase
MRFTAVYVQLFIALAYCSSAQQPLAGIRVNQVGYYPHAPKIAVIVGNPSTTKFLVRNVATGVTVYSGTVSEPRLSTNSSLQTRISDFSALRIPGDYKISIPGMPDSYTFSIRNKIHHSVCVSSMKGYFYQRVSMPLEEKFAGKWKRGAGHPDTAVLIHASAASKSDLQERPSQVPVAGMTRAITTNTL